MREESLSFLSFLMSLLMFLFISEIRARKLQQCSSSCGEINNINYPFRLRGDPANCGDSDFELSCESNKTILEFNSEKYYVKEIFHRERIINVVNVNLANGSCSLPYKSPVTEDNLPQFYYPIVTHASVDFLKCYRNISDRDYSRVPCLSGNNSFVYITYSTYSVSDIPVSCTVISVVSSQFHLMSTFNETPPYETFREILQLGHNLTWSVECRDCLKDSGHCGIIPTLSSPPTFPFICHYDEGFIETQILSRLEEIKQALLALFHSDSFSEYLDYFLNATSQTIFLFLCFVPLISRFIIAPTILLLYILHKYRRKYNRTDNVEKFLHNQQSWMPKRYSYAEIMAMTNHFEVHLGKGGFGSVYKGQLRRGCLIAVKVLENSKFCAEEFINEVSTIGRIHHVNVVQLVGFCAEGSKRALVYEYMPNGSLDRHIFSKVDGGTTSFSWEKLHEIALATARGIEYLHVGCDVCILHFDIKPHNILLDHNFHPKVSDFGLAKFYPKENDFVSVSATRGTIGYIAPELVSRNFGTISCKSDVYSFGMLLLEMVGGRRNSDMREARSSRAYFPSWVYDRINLREDLELPNVSEIEVAIAKKLCIIGLWCIQVKPVDRPSMTKVMEMLEGSIDELQMPPKPFFSSTQHISIGEIESDSSNQWLLSESIEESMIVE